MSYASLEDGQWVSPAGGKGQDVVNPSGNALPETPFGGTKDSGFGHEGGIEGL